MSDAKKRLMAYSKETLVNFVMRRCLLIEDDWRYLAYESNRLQIRSLLDRSGELIELSKNKHGSEWWQLQDELDKLQEKIDRLSERQSKILGLREAEVLNG